MRAAADIEQDAVGGINGDERRVALAPVGDEVEQACIGRLILGHRNKRRVHGSRLRQCETGAQAGRFGGGFDCNQHVEIAAPAEDYEGRR